MGQLLSGVKPNVLVVVLDLPFPAASGSELRNWQTVQALLDVARVGVFGLRDQVVRAAPCGDIALWGAAQDPTFAQPDKPASASVDTSAVPAAFSPPLFSLHAAAKLEASVREFRPDVVIVAQLWLHPYIDMLRALGCRVVFDAHNVEAALYREVTASEAGGRASRWARLKLAEHMAQIEAAAVARADQVWVCSEADARLVRKLYHPGAEVQVIPNTVDVASYERARPQPSAGPTLIFPGLLHYPPNQAAALFLIQEVFPRLVERRPAARLLLVGSHPSPALLDAAHRHPHIVVTGRVPDTRPYFAQASVMVVPLFQGSGTRYKILEAFAAGLPVVSTAKGVEGLEAMPQTHFLPAESPEDFVDAILRLVTHPDQAQLLARSGFDLVSERYSLPVARSRIAAALDRLLS